MSQNRLAIRYRNLVGQLDGLTGASKQKFGAAVQCRSGCGLCCHGLFDVGILDALTLHAAWRESPERDSIEQAAEELLAKIADLAPAWRYPYDLRGHADDEIDGVLERLGMVACPVLSMEQHCRLYESRPFYCRVHGLKIRDSGGAVDIDTECELNFPEPPPRAAWPAFDFSALFAAEGRLVQEYGLDADSKFLIPAVTTRRFTPIAVAAAGQ